MGGIHILPAKYDKRKRVKSKFVLDFIVDNLYH